MTDTPVPAGPEDTPAETGTRERVAKVIARSGYASRRDAEKMILEGRVTVNGKAIDSPALDVAPKDKVAIDGKPIDAPQETRVWLYYKPLGLVTTEKDDQGRRTIFDEMPAEMPRVLNVGRLDLNSEGLLLLTNDGGLKRRLEHPETAWLRKYRVRVNGRPTDDSFNPLRAGITIEGEEFQPMEITLDRQQGANAWLTVGIREGKNREIRRAMTAIDLTVNRLIRVSYGPFRLNEMQPGDVVEIKRKVLRDQLGDRLLTGAEDGRPSRAEREARPRDDHRENRRDDRRGEAAPKRPGKPGPKRPATGGDAEAPRKGFGYQRDFSGEGGPRPRRQDAADKPRSAGFRSHHDADERPAGAGKPYGKRPAPRGEEDRKGGFSARSEGQSRFDRPQRSADGVKPGTDRPRKFEDRGDRPRGDKPSGFKPREDRPWGDKPSGFKPRGDRPQGDRPDGYKPRGDRPQGEKPSGFKPRGDTSWGDKPAGFKPRGDRPQGDRPDGYKPRGDRPQGEKPSGFKPRGDRSWGDKPSGFKPREDRPQGDRPDGYKPRGDRPQGEKSSGFKPRGDKSWGDKPTGFKPRGDRPQGDRPDGFKPRGDRPQGGKPSGFKPRGEGTGPREDRPQGKGFKSHGSKSHGGSGKPRAEGFRSHRDAGPGSDRPKGPRRDR